VDFADFVEARVAEDEALARAASTPYEYADDGAAAREAGVHWTWATGPSWTPTLVDPALDEHVGGEANYGHSVQLVTVEQWPSHRQSMPQYAATDIMEFRSTWAAHIVRHDPARVLRHAGAARAVLRLYENARAAVGQHYEGTPRQIRVQDETYAEALRDVLVELAAAWADHPDYSGCT
jgi:hypothetical protein